MHLSVTGISYLRQITPEDVPEAVDLLIYFDHTYVSGSLRRVREQENVTTLRMRRIPPLFSPTIWNVHEATLHGDPRTNNICEGWNNRFFNLVGHYHPSIWRLIEWLRREEAATRSVIEQSNVGILPTRRVRQRYTRMQTRLRNLCVARRDNRNSVADFLDGVGWNICLTRELNSNS